jgi:hypothetical protein
MKFRTIKIIMIAAGIVATSSCKKLMDINKDPDRLPANANVYPQLLTSAQVGVGFEGGSDLFRYATLIMQQMSGLASAFNQTYDYSRYNISPTDVNNQWNTTYANTLSDLELVIKQATAAGSPYYAGVAKILKAYKFALQVDAWGDVPFSEALQLDANTHPKYDDDATIYPKLIALLIEAVTDLGAASSVQSPGTNSIIYSNADFTAVKPNWIKLANTLRLRLLLHYSKVDPAFCVAQITALVNTAGITFFASNADNFQVPFFNVASQRNSIETFERNRAGYLYADEQIVGMMNAKSDPRRPTYFAIFPFDFTAFNLPTSQASTGTVLRFLGAPLTTAIAPGMTVTGAGIPARTIVASVAAFPTSGTATHTDVTLNDFGPVTFVLPSIPSGTVINFKPEYRGVSAAAPPLNANGNYSRVHTFLRGATLTGVAAPPPYTGTVQPYTYTGAAPQRLLTYAEYCFIRAEAAILGAPGNAQQFFTDGITASMLEAGVAAPAIATYLAANGTLAGTNAQKIKQIIEEKFIANYGVSMEPWSDWRRTGYPVLTIPPNRLSSVPTVPRSLFYPQLEVDLNPSVLTTGGGPGQKAIDLQGRVFWDTP